MSDSTRKNLASLVNEKITKLDTLIQGAANSDAKFQTFDNYNLFFTGVTEGLAAAGVSADDSKPVTAAKAHIDASIAALEAHEALLESISE